MFDLRDNMLRDVMSISEKNSVAHLKLDMTERHACSVEIYQTIQRQAAARHRKGGRHL